jgi:hypothetical protein
MRHYLLGRHFNAYTDHFSLQYFQSQPQLSGHRARWNELRQEFNVTTHYKAGQNNIVPHALSRRPNVNVTSVSSFDLATPEVSIESQDAVSSWKQIRSCLSKYSGLNPSETILCRNYALIDGRLHRRGSLCIPPGPLRLQLLRESHDSVFADNSTGPIFIETLTSLLKPVIFVSV